MVRIMTTPEPHKVMPTVQADVASLGCFVRECFTTTVVEQYLGAARNETERVSREWLLTGGKRWRPLLTAAIYKAAGGALEHLVPVLLAVESFHKASLVHDDIEDGDSMRYGAPTVHKLIGVPAAINVGDYLIGEGYRLLTGAKFDAATRLAMLEVAAEGHLELCRGQGAELAYSRQPEPLSLERVLHIYQQKTAAAFEVALLVGARAAGVAPAVCLQLAEFSKAVGIAYQLEDDIADAESTTGRAADLLVMRPTIFLAQACASERADLQALLQAIWQGGGLPERQALIAALKETDFSAVALELALEHKKRARKVVVNLADHALRELLLYVMGTMWRSQ